MLSKIQPAGFAQCPVTEDSYIIFLEKKTFSRYLMMELLAP